MESIARILVLLLLVALLVNLMAGGWPQVKKWFHAKFIGTA